MGKAVSFEDRKMKIKLNAKASFLIKIQEISDSTGIKKTDILELCLENCIPMLEKISEKIRLLKETPLEGGN